ncbi:MAG: hypothetical protein ACRDKB_04115 [Actinomycetota bacterium]
MTHTRLLAPILVGALLASTLVVSGTAAAQKKGKKKSGPQVVGEDPADDLRAATRTASSSRSATAWARSW